MGIPWTPRMISFFQGDDDEAVRETCMIIPGD